MKAKIIYGSLLLAAFGIASQINMIFYFCCLYLGIELLIHIATHLIRKRFQWLILTQDKYPTFSKALLDKYFADGFDPELGWSRKPNTMKYEQGKYGQTCYHIDAQGARRNSEHEHLPIVISTFGDSFTFGRQVNDNETFQWYLSELTRTNVLNYGVGNYGFDQALLRLKKEFPKIKSRMVIMGVVPSTIVRILSVWKHYNEFGNTLAFKPRYQLNGQMLQLVTNKIDSREKFEHYAPYLSEINRQDDFYHTKFLREMLHFPYVYSLLKGWPRHRLLLPTLLCDMARGQFEASKAKIMEINLKLRMDLFQQSSPVALLLALLDEFTRFAHENNCMPILAWLPQKDDVLTVQAGNHYYADFIKTARQKLEIIDMTDTLVSLPSLSELYSDDSLYGGHFSREGNYLVAKTIYQYLLTKSLLEQPVTKTTLKPLPEVSL